MYLGSFCQPDLEVTPAPSVCSFCYAQTARSRMEEAAAVEGEEVGRLFLSHLGGKERQDLEERGNTDFTLSLGRAGLDDGRGPAWRFRVTLHCQRGEPAAALRALPSGIPSLASLNLPPALADLVKPSRRLILVCGPTGSGNSSTVPAIVRDINFTC